MDILAAELGANMAINSLENSGQIGSIAVNKEIIFPFTALEFEVIDEETGISGTSIQTSAELLEAAVDNKSLTFTFDGTNYLCPANYLEGMGVLWGNGSFFGMEDTGEPFAFGVEVNNLQTSFLCITGGIHTAEISLVSEIVKPIDPKCLPIGKSIDLDNYGNGLQSINAVIVMLAIGDTGGGTFTYENGMEQFWADVLAKQPDYLIFRIYGNEIRVTIGGLYVTEAALQEGSAAISAVGLLTLYGMSVMGNFVLTQEGEAGLKIAVEADPVEFPDYVLAP